MKIELTAKNENTVFKNAVAILFLFLLYSSLHTYTDSCAS